VAADRKGFFSRTGADRLTAALLVAASLLFVRAAPVYGGPISLDITSPASEQMDFEHLWNMTLHNPNPDTESATLRVEASEVKAGVVFSANTQKIKLAPGELRLTSRDVKLDSVSCRKGYEAFVAKGHRLPEGDYSYVITPGPGLKQTALFFRIRVPKPVELTWPPNNSAVTDSQVVFAWTPPVASGPIGVYRYLLRVAEVARGQNGATALKRNRPVFEDREFWPAACRLPARAGVLVPGRTYAWCVAASDTTNPSVDTTHTESRAGTFVYRPGANPADTGTNFTFPYTGRSVTGNASMVVASGLPDAELCLLEYALGGDSMARDWHPIGVFPKAQQGYFVGLWASDSAVTRAGRTFPSPVVVRATVLDRQGRHSEALLPLVINPPPPPTRKGCGCH